MTAAGYAMEQKSSIIAIGLSVHHTPVDIREKLSIPEVGPALRTRAARWHLGSSQLWSDPLPFCRPSGHAPSRSSRPSHTSRRQPCCPPATAWSSMWWRSPGTGCAFGHPKALAAAGCSRPCTALDQLACRCSAGTRGSRAAVLMRFFGDRGCARWRSG